MSPEIGFVCPAAAIVQRAKGRDADMAHALLLSRVAMTILHSVQDTWTANGAKGSLAEHVEDAFDVFRVVHGTSASRRHRNARG
jgi:hypothetical protein